MRARLTILAALLLLFLPSITCAQIAVRAVRFEGATHVSRATLEKIAARYRGKPVTDRWLGELSGRVKDAEQQLGYFKCLVQEKQEHIAGKGNRQYVIARVTITEGEQYRLKSLSVVNAKAFPAEELVALFSLRPGDIFNTAVIRKGLEDLRKTYGAGGYINFTAVPDARIDDQTRTIALTIDVAEGDAYHVGKIEVLGLSEKRTQRLVQNLALKPGEAYRPFDVEAFYRQNRSLLPRGAKPDTTAFIQPDHDKHIVDITLDFRPWCEKISLGCHPFADSRGKK